MNFAPDKKIKILLVDDRKENLISLEEMLADDHRIFIKADSGNEALKIVLRYDDIGLIMLDVQMPEMDGFEVARILKSNSRTKNINIIFVTAISKEEKYVLKGFGSGALDYLHKPLDIELTKAKVHVFEQLYFYEQELKLALEERDKINKYLERFMHVVAHDLKSPLAGIVTLTSVLQENKKIEADPSLKEYVDRIHSSSMKLSGMISSILEYSRNVDINEAAEEVDTRELVEQIAILLFSPKHVHISIVTEMPVFKTKQLKLQQVFQNLIGNAIKYNDKTEGLIEIGCKAKEEFYEFYVKDNGPGIEEADHEKIFRLFETTDNISTRESSTGLGLNIIKILVEEQGGTIRVESNPGEGSVFYFEWRK